MFKGIDISEWQGFLSDDDFIKIKNDGIDFAIIRCGYTSYGKSKKKYVDKCFENNYALAKKYEIPVGVYYYSCATTLKEAMEEANFIKEIIKDKTFEYPVCIDTEDNHDIYNSNYSDSSQYSIGKNSLTDIIKTICNDIEKNGYYVSIYASTSWFKSNLNIDDLTIYDKWIAQWSKSVNFGYKYGIWQYTSTGKVNGINGYVDLNYSYKDYKSLIISNGLNGYKLDSKQPDSDVNNDTNSNPDHSNNNNDTDLNPDDSDDINEESVNSLKKIIISIIELFKKLFNIIKKWLYK